jgi:hypothetical protein
MRPQQTSITGVGSSPWLVFDYQSSGVVALQATVTGTITWTLESTQANPLTTNPIPAGSIMPSDDATMVNQTASRQSNYISAPRACRVTTSAGTGTVVLNATQFTGNN